jgi:hypothetical protein
VRRREEVRGERGVGGEKWWKGANHVSELSHVFNYLFQLLITLHLPSYLLQIIQSQNRALSSFHWSLEARDLPPLFPAEKANKHTHPVGITTISLAFESGMCSLIGWGTRESISFPQVE